METSPPFCWVSDRVGRENTMFFAFALEGVAMTLWLPTRDNAVLFVLFSGLVIFGWGEIFSLFPSTLTDTFGTRHTAHGTRHTARHGQLRLALHLARHRVDPRRPGGARVVGKAAYNVKS